MRPAVTCTNNIVPGYYFDATVTTYASAIATTYTCAPGLAGYATRRCLWNGPTSAAGVWENPISYCERTLMSVHGPGRDRRRALTEMCAHGQVAKPRPSRHVLGVDRV